jgi:BirA family biotin operon repressor/biotin-[acetyl-CoA-carboxylase] ligase
MAMIKADLLRKGLRTRRFGRRLFTFETIDSTNTCAKVLASCWAVEGTVIIAEEQTEGKGRLGRSWFASPGQNLTFSLVLRPTGPAEDLNLIPLYVGVAVADAIRNLTGLPAKCKWPNDIMINERKTAGVLIEGSLKDSSVEFVIVGIGVNVNQREFPGGLSETATSLALASGSDVDRAELFREIMRSLETHYDKLKKEGVRSIIPLWTDRTTMIGRKISVSQNGVLLEGVAQGVNEQGALVLANNGSSYALMAGDVTILDHRIPAH